MVKCLSFKFTLINWLLATLQTIFHAGGILFVWSRKSVSFWAPVSIQTQPETTFSLWNSTITLTRKTGLKMYSLFLKHWYFFFFFYKTWDYRLARWKEASSLQFPTFVQIMEGPRKARIMALYKINYTDFLLFMRSWFMSYRKAHLLNSFHFVVFLM